MIANLKGYVIPPIQVIARKAIYWSLSVNRLIGFLKNADGNRVTIWTTGCRRSVK